MKKFIILSTLFIFVLSLSGCATFFTEGRGNINTSSNPSGAEVFVNGVKVGETPTTIKLKRKGEYTIEMKKDGYKPQTFRVTNRVGVGWVILDVLCGLVPVIVDAATGSWNIFDEKNFNAELEKNAPYPCPVP